MAGKTKPKPNYHIKHVDGYDIDIHITPTVIANLNGRDPNRRENAINHICVKVRKSFIAKFRQFPNRRVEWNQISMTAIPETSVPNNKEVECDDCVSCDLGYHERCTNGCTRGRPKR